MRARRGERGETVRMAGRCREGYISHMMASRGGEGMDSGEGVRKGRGVVPCRKEEGQKEGDGSGEGVSKGSDRVKDVARRRRGCLVRESKRRGGKLGSG